MARKLFAFLGASAYEPCYYYLTHDNEQITDSECRCYIQESLINLLLRIDKKLDEIVIFLTNEAYKKNWIKNSNNTYGLQGLKDTLNMYEEEYIITPVKIPSGISEKELWQIFDKVFNEIDQEDEIIFDITHSLRSLPMIAIIILNYAKFIKKCDIGGIYYGAVEARCPPSKLKELPLEERHCPIFDLTSFVKLLDWTVAIDKFLNTGSSRDIEFLIDVTRERFGRLYEYDRANFFKHLKTSIHSYTNSITTCRGREISNMALGLKSMIEESSKSPELFHIKPIIPLLEKNDLELKSYTDNQHMNMLEVAKWCYEHDLIQQGITILQEGIITFLCEKYTLDSNNIDVDRKIINQASRIKAEKLDVKGWKKPAVDNVETVKRIIDDKYFKEASDLLNSMTETRNDINHAGWVKQPLEPKVIKENLKKFIEGAENLLKT